MNIVFWVLQVLVALLAVSGGAYKVFKFEEIAKQPTIKALPRAVWTILGVLELGCGVLVIVPLAIGWMPVLTPLAAGLLALENLGLSALYARHSVKLTSANPMVWSAAMGLLAAIVAYGRNTL